MPITYASAMSVLNEIFVDLGDDLDLDGESLLPGSKVLDLGLESISLVYLISELQQHFGLEDALFRKMRDEDLLLKNMTVDDIVRSVVELGARPSV